MYAFAVFTEKYLQAYGCCDTTFTATVNCTNPKTEIQIEIIETEIIGIQILLWNKKIFLHFWQTCLFAVK